MREEKRQVSAEERRQNAQQRLAMELRRDMDEKALRSLYKQLGLSKSPFASLNSGEKLAERISAYWFQPRRAYQTVSSLSREEVLALAKAASYGGEFYHDSWIQSLRRAHQGTEKEWNAAIERLMQRGLLIKLSYPSHHYGVGPCYYFPQVLFELIGPFLPQSSALGRLGEPRPGMKVTNAPHLTVSYCAALLCALNQNKVRRNQSGTLNKSDLKRLAKLFPSPLPFPLEASIVMLNLSGALKLDSQQYLEPVPEQVAHVLGSEQRLGLVRLAAIIALHHPLFQMIFAVMFAALPGQWAMPASIEAALVWVRYNLGYLFQELSDAYGPMAIGSYQHEPINRLMEMAANHSFFDALRDETDQIVAVRLSDEFLSLCRVQGSPANQNTASAESKPKDDTLHMQPNFEIIAPPDVPGSMLARLIRFVDLKQMDVVVTYRLTASSCRRAARDGVSAEEVLRFLNENSRYGVPDNVAHMVRDWMRGAGSVRFVQGLILHCRNAEAAAAIRQNAALRHWILEELSDGLFVINSDGFKKVVALLEQMGYPAPREIQRYSQEEPSEDNRFIERFYPSSRYDQRPNLEPDMIQGLLQTFLNEARALWAGNDIYSIQPTPHPPAAEFRHTIDDEDDLDDEDDFDENDDLDERGLDERIHYDPSDSEIPPLEALTPLRNEALEDALVKAVDFGMNAFISYPENESEPPRVDYVTPLEVESSGRFGNLLAFSHKTKANRRFALRKIQGVLLHDIPR